MKKTLIAAAIAAASSVSMAATVEVFGQVDTYIAINSNGGDYSTAIKSGGASASHFGFQGSEQLWEGTRVAFKMDSAILSDTGALSDVNGTLFSREVWVGIQNDRFGSLSFGRQYTPHFLVFAMTDPTDLSLGTAASPYFFPSNAGVTGDASDDLVRHSNSILYVSPRFAGLQVMLYGALGEESKDDGTTSNTRGNIYNLGLNYANGPLFIAASLLYQKYSGANYTNAAYTFDGYGVDGTQEGRGLYYNIGATYDLGFTKLAALFMKKEGSDNANMPDFWIAQLGAATPVFGGRWSISFATLHNESVADADAWSFGTRFDYPLSKRTKVYVGFSTVLNDDNARYSVEAGPDSSWHFANTYGTDQRQFFFGINHSF